MIRTLHTRRNALAAIGAAWAGGVLAVGEPRHALAAEEPIPSLRALAAARGITFGMDSDVDFAAAPPEYLALFLRQSALFAPPFGWNHISPRPGVYDFSHHRASIDLAFRNGLKLTGCHFLWHESAPAWLATLTRAEAERAIIDFITRAATEFRGHVYAWNVINEAINPRDGRPDLLRAGSTFVKVFGGMDYLVPAFQAARAADPQALLVCNDYALDLAGQDANRTGMLRMVDFLQSKHAPIDAVGLQSHLKAASFGDFDERRYRAFLKEIASRGLKILITELDVMDLGLPSDITRRDQMVADIYARFLRVALDEPAVKSVVVWGLSDRYTWLTPHSSPGYARPDGLPTRPLPFDDAFRPKPAFFAIANALKAAPSR
jgi:endo-1,4-beta-xylanase